MVNKDKYIKGHKAMKKLDGAEHENMQILRESINILFENAGIQKPEKLKRLNELFDE